MSSLFWCWIKNMVILSYIDLDHRGSRGNSPAKLSDLSVTNFTIYYLKIITIKIKILNSWKRRFYFLYFTWNMSFHWILMPCFVWIRVLHFEMFEFRLSFVLVLLMVGYFLKWSFKISKGIRRYQRGRQKSLSRNTDKTMANKMKRKTNIENTTLHFKLKLGLTRTLQKPGWVQVLRKGKQLLDTSVVI